MNSGNLEQIKDAVREYLRAELAKKALGGAAPLIALEDQSPIFSSSGFDSLAFIDLIFFLESNFGTVVPRGLKKDDLDTIEKISTFVLNNRPGK